MIITKNQHFFYALFIFLIFFIPCSVYAGCNNIESDTYKLDFERQYEEAFAAGDFNRIGELKAQRMSQASASENCNEQLQSTPATSTTHSTAPTTVTPADTPILMEPPPWLSSTPETSVAASADSLPTFTNTTTPILMEPPDLTSAAPSPIVIVPDSEQIFIPSTFTHDSRTNDELWQDAQDQLNAPPASPTLDANEFVEYIERIESQYPDATWQQIAAALHAEGYGNDVNGSTMPIFDGSLTGVPWNKFLMGPETDGYEDILKHLSVSVYKAKNYRKGRITRRTPKYVTRSDGQLMDIQHSYAGLRSDLNRGVDKWYNRPKSDLMRWTQTDGGDSYQEIIFAPQASWEAGEPTWSTAHAPPKQRAGNALGIWLSNYYRDPKHKKTPLSQAYRDYFESDILVE